MALDLKSGTVVAGRYRLDRLLGQGGMGSVWAATHTITRKRLALKFLRAADELGAQTRQRFLQEARTACAVDHPNIVPIHDVFELDDGTPLMVMALLEGETLRDRLDQQDCLSLEQTAAIMLPVVSAVGTAHARGIIHRDLKPENIFLVTEPDGTQDVVVLDFGIAKLAAPDEPTDADVQTSDAAIRTGTGAVLGSPAYMSPEQATAERDLDHRVDIWALGIMLYEALSGVRPIDGANFGQIVKRLVTGTIPPLEQLAPELPEPVTDLVGQMLAREPDDRLADLRAAAEVLEPYGDVRPPSFGRPGSLPTPAADSAGGHSEPESNRAATTAAEAPSARRDSERSEASGKASGPDVDADTVAEARPAAEHSANRPGLGRHDTAAATTVAVAARPKRGATYIVAAVVLAAAIALALWRFGSPPTGSSALENTTAARDLPGAEPTATTTSTAAALPEPSRTEPSAEPSGEPVVETTAPATKPAAARTGQRPIATATTTAPPGTSSSTSTPSTEPPTTPSPTSASTSTHTGNLAWDPPF